MSVALRTNRALLEAFEAAREKLTSELDGLDRARELLEQERVEGDLVPGSMAKRRKSRGRGRKPAPGTPEDVRKRCDAIDDLLAERRADLSTAQIARELGLTIDPVRTALAKLRKQKRVRLVKKGRRTVYRTLRPLATEQPITDKGRFIEVVRDRGYASRDEVAQALGVPYEKVVEIGGELVAEGELNMDHRNGSAVYLIPRKGV